MSIHAEWLSLIEISGAFLAEPILDQAFPQGLEGLETSKKQAFRQAYEEWREALDTDDELQAKLHQEWINWVLKIGLEWDEDNEGEELKASADVPAHLKLELLEHKLTLKPDYALFANEPNKPYLLVASYPAHVVLTDVVAGDGWSTTPAERMSHLCRATGTRLGLVTNGEQWMVVDAPESGITSYASWYARLWSQEPVTLKAFFSLLNIRSVFSGFGLDAKKLTELLDESLKHQDEVTETLGTQVQRAVEVLIQSIDRINNDSNGELLKGVAPTELYEAGLTYMMRLVFLLCAEERGLLLLGDETYEANYAVSTLRMKLREEAGLHGEEVLSYRNNAWARLLAVFRAVYGGVEHEGMRMPALGGSLFDPDRFPFFEGRSKDSNWKIDEARPLPIDNRTVLLFLDAIQLYQGRTLSYRALDVEQIGYVYEGLLERTVIRATDVTIELDANKNAKKPWVLLGELESAKLDGEAEVKKLLKERMSCKASRVTNDLTKVTSEAESEKLLLACQNDTELRDRIKPYYHFLRMDSWSNPLLYLKDAFMVATGTERRETGTHYTPKLLTEVIVLDTLEPLVYIGPSEGKERSEWTLRSPEELLDLKVCDFAMGSGAFLVQVCRYLSERLFESWALAETKKKIITVGGCAVDSLHDQEMLAIDAEERLITARRLVGEKCLYGVDVNPLAVELAKLSIWLVTLAKGRPFGFLDHNLRHGDSLLGITGLDQLHYLDMKPGKGSERKLFAQKIDQAVEEAIKLRLKLRQQPILDIRDVELMTHLDQQSRYKMGLPVLIADALVGETFGVGGSKVDVTRLSIEAGMAFEGEEVSLDMLRRRAKAGLSKDLPSGKSSLKAFHWCLEFPEVFLGDRSGFDAIVGNPPYLGGNKISGSFGGGYRTFISSIIAEGKKGAADLSAFFLLQSLKLISGQGFLGVVTTSSVAEGDTREVGLDQFEKKGMEIISADKNRVWEGAASVTFSMLIATKKNWYGSRYADGLLVDKISPSLTEEQPWDCKPHKLKSNKGMSYIGSYLLGTGFVMSMDAAIGFIEENDKNKNVLFPVLSGGEVNGTPNHQPSRYAINFFDWPLVLDEHEEDNKSNYAENYPDLLEVVRENVKPLRDNSNRKVRREKWWQYAEKANNLYRSIEGKPWVIGVASAATKYEEFAILPSNIVFTHSITVIPLDDFGIFAILSSELHKCWVRVRASYNLSLLRYTPSDCLETFPFSTVSVHLKELGEMYHKHRSVMMESRGEGLTDIYNRYHNNDDWSPDVTALRKIQMEITSETLKCYGWNDIQLDYAFYDTKQGSRFTIDNQSRYAILTRLTLLNQELHDSEINENNIKLNKKFKKPSTLPTSQQDMFGE